MGGWEKAFVNQTIDSGKYRKYVRISNISIVGKQII